MSLRAYSNFRYLCKYKTQFRASHYHVNARESCMNPIFRRLSINYCSMQCWRCGTRIETSDIFCKQCSAVQKPGENKTYFDIIGIETTYEVNDKELVAKYRKLQNILHPDRFSTKDEEEHKISEHYSSLVNKAYSTLHQPLARGLYMLRLQGFNLEEDTMQTDSKFLAEIMEINEELADAQQPEDVKRLESNNRNMLQKLIRDVTRAFDANDMDAAKQILVKMKYYSSIEARIKDLKQKMGIE